jgi:serine/threonine-protein kinase RsbW
VTTNQRAQDSGRDAGSDAPGGAGVPFGADAAAQRMAVLSFPADKNYLALARTTAMHVAGLLDLPLSRVTDLRLAVDEACAVFLTAPHSAGAVADRPAGAPTVLELRYDLYPGRLCVSVRAPVPASWPEADELGWTMLQALVSEVRTEVADGIGTLVLVEQLAPPAPSGAAPAAG